LVRVTSRREACIGHGCVTGRGSEILIAKDFIAKIRWRGGADECV